MMYTLRSAAQSHRSVRDRQLAPHLPREARAVELLPRLEALLAVHAWPLLERERCQVGPKDATWPMHSCGNTAIKC
jgi:hypothetical protein